MNKQKESLTALEYELTPLQRIHFHILIQARQDYLTAMNWGYITENGEINENAIKFKKGGCALEGGFNTPLYKKELHQLVEYWQSDAPNRSLEILGIAEHDAGDFLNKLNYSYNSKKG